MYKYISSIKFHAKVHGLKASRGFKASHVTKETVKQLQLRVRTIVSVRLRATCFHVLKSVSKNSRVLTR